MKNYLPIILLIGILTSRAQAQNVYANSQTNTTTGVCLSCSITNPNYSVDNDVSNYAKFNQPVAILGASVYQVLSFPSQGPAGATITTLVEDDNLGILDASVLGGLQIRLKKDASVLSTLNMTGISINLLSGSTTRYTLKFNSCCDFNAVEIGLLSGIAGALTKLRVYYSYYYVSPLPVELLEFNATADENKIKISWQTASENNNNYFTLEKSKDGIEFSDLKRIPGAGDSHSLLAYSFNDDDPEPGINYYRLRQTDFNSNEKVFKIIAINYRKMKSLQFHEMPFNEELEFSFTPLSCNEYQISIYSASGIKLYTEKTMLEVDVQQEITVRPYSLKAGVYFLEMSCKEELIIQKIIKR